MLDGKELSDAILDAYERGRRDGREGVLDEDRRFAYDQYRDLLRDSYIDRGRIIAPPPMAARQVAAS